MQHAKTRLFLLKQDSGYYIIEQECVFVLHLITVKPYILAAI